MSKFTINRLSKDEEMEEGELLSDEEEGEETDDEEEGTEFQVKIEGKKLFLKALKNEKWILRSIK